ncbi:MAG TPA: PepSY-associated TM helix domain-containing protein, partial [Blastocatellia bacterium]|nr:PepSY-associated TM helix domain-containing protein [Blastocatellia bacterium]
MKQFRKIIFWCHLTAGVVAGVIVLIMSVTGVLLTYEKQIIAWADERNYKVAVPESGATHLPVETILAKVRESQPGIMPVSITLKSEPTSPMALVLSGNRTIFVNPYTAQVLGEAPKGFRNFFHVVTDWHRWLGTEGAGRATGRAITGACNLAFLFIVVSGFYLWFPRTLTWPQFKNILWFRRRLRSKARDFNWHNVIGFWSLVPLFIIVLSGAVISYPWASNLVYRVVGENPP